MIDNPPENTAMLLEGSNIHDGWSAALLQNGEIINRFDKDTEPEKHQQTEELIQQFLTDYEPKGFEGEW
jgi:hypothetical protein